MYDQTYSSNYPGSFSFNSASNIIPPTPELAAAIDTRDIVKEKNREIKKEINEEGPPLQGALATVTEEAYRNSIARAALVDQLGGYKTPPRRVKKPVSRKRVVRKGGKLAQKRRAPIRRKKRVVAPRRKKRVVKRRRQRQISTLF